MKHLIAFVVTLVLVFGISDTYAQKTTEIFIPIGQSPGVSSKYSVIAKIDQVKAQGQSLVIADSSGSYTVKITEGTKIWLDKSKLKLTNQQGAFSDFQKGLLIEVKYKESELKNTVTAEWIKVKLTK